MSKSHLVAESSAPPAEAAGRRSGGRAAIGADGAGAKVAFGVLDLSGNQTLPAYDYLLRGVSKAAVARRIDLHVLFLSDTAVAIDRLSRSGFDGLILHGTFEPVEQSRPLHKMPTVWLMGNRERPVWGDQVMPDNVTIGQIAARHLLRGKGRRMMYFGLRIGWSLDVRMLAFRQAVEDAGGDVVAVAHDLADPRRPTGDDTEAAVAALVRAYRAERDKPTGLFVAEDSLVRPAYAALQAAGVKIGPGGLDVISCNNDPFHLVGVTPMPPTIDIRYETMGYRAVEQLAVRLTRPGPDDRLRLMLEPALVMPK